jgi:hypothetical protein
VLKDKTPKHNRSTPCVRQSLSRLWNVIITRHTGAIFVSCKKLWQSCSKQILSHSKCILFWKSKTSWHCLRTLYRLLHCLAWHIAPPRSQFSVKLHYLIHQTLQNVGLSALTTPTRVIATSELWIIYNTSCMQDETPESRWMRASTLSRRACTVLRTKRPLHRKNRCERLYGRDRAASTGCSQVSFTQTQVQIR